MKEEIYKTKLDMDDKLKFGLEIEVEDVFMYQIKEGLARIESNWCSNYDYSLQDAGGELISPILTNKEVTYVELKKICDLLKELKANPTKNASFQIHYSMDIFKNNYLNLLNFYKLWSIYENIIYKYSYGESGVPRQTIYTYAIMCRKRIHDIINTKEYIPFGEYKNNKLVENIDNYTIILGNNRSYGLSFRYDDYKNLKDSKTIEIRTINGTIDEILIQNYIKFFYELLSYPSKEKFDQGFIDYKYNKLDFSDTSINNSLKININEALELSNLILDNEYDKDCFIRMYTGDNKLIKKL